MNVSPRVLLVDDDKMIQWSVGAALAEAGYLVRPAVTIAEARPLVSAGVDLVLLDLSLPDGNGLDLLQALLEADPDLAVIMLTGTTDMDTVVRAIRAGAFHYVAKPVNMEELIALAGRALETVRLRTELESLRHTGDDGSAIGLDRIVGRSDAIKRTRAILASVARSPASTVLLTGETGTGKDLAASVIHEISDRAPAPFIHVTCTALAETLFESELFGHERGAFTDARHQREGLLEQARGGTVFLDEIGELSPAMQAKLLRFLEDKTIRRLGGMTDIRLDVRVIAATNRDLNADVEAGAFREDLFFRLQVLPVEIPALRQRTGDVRLLAQLFARRFASRFHKRACVLSDELHDRLDVHHWPGNVRELRNTMERAVLLSQDGACLTPDDVLLPPVLSSGVDTAVALTAGATVGADAGGLMVLPPDGIDLDKLERELLRQALLRVGGNQSRAAALLGMHRDQVRYRVNKFGLGDLGKS